MVMGGPCAGRGIERGPDMAVSQSREPGRNFPGKLFNIHFDDQLSLGWTERDGWKGTRVLCHSEWTFAKSSQLWSSSILP